MCLVTVASTRTVLAALEQGKMRPVDLHREIGPGTSLRTIQKRLGELEGLGAIGKHEVRSLPRAVEYELLPAGRALSLVAGIAEAWLRQAPAYSPALAADSWRWVAALADGWSGGLIRHLAREPAGQAELERSLEGASHFEIKGRLRRMHEAGIAELLPSGGVGRRYELSDWGRAGIAVIAAAGRFEREHLADGPAPIGPDDAVTALLLALPIVVLADGWSGVLSFCATVDVDHGFRHQAEAVWVEMREGRVVAAGEGPGPTPDGWAQGSIGEWMAAVIGGTPKALQLGGDRATAAAVVEQLHQRLFESLVGDALH